MLKQLNNNVQMYIENIFIFYLEDNAQIHIENVFHTYQQQLFKLSSPGVGT